MKPVPPAPWGSPCTPLLPQWHLDTLATVPLPSRLLSRSAFVFPGASLQFVGDLGRYWQFKSTPLSSRDLRLLSLVMSQQPNPPEEHVVIPSTADLPRLLECPFSTQPLKRLEGALDAGRLEPGRPVTVAMLLQLEHFGVISLLEVMSVVEAAICSGFLAGAHGEYNRDGRSSHSTAANAAEASKQDLGDATAVLRKHVDFSGELHGSRTSLMQLPSLVEAGIVRKNAGPHVLQSASVATSPPSQAVALIRDFAAWALAETAAGTLGEAVNVVNTRRGVEEWAALAALRLDRIADPPEHPYALLDAWSEELDDRERYVFHARIARPDRPRTLRELGDELGLTAERVRQLGKGVEESLAAFVDSPLGSRVRWRIATLAARIGVASPRAHVDGEFALPKGVCGDYGELLLQLAGPYHESHGWLIHRSARGDDPTSAIREMKDEVGRIDRLRASKALANWGLNPSLHEGFMRRDGTLRDINGHLVHWDGPITDKLAFVLDELGEPATVAGLLSFAEEERGIPSTKTALARDDRFVRADRTRWALASWGLPEYEGIAATIGRLLEEGGQPMLVSDVVDRLTADFGIAANSAHSFCHAAMFVVEDGLIRLGGEREPYSYKNPDVARALGVFALGDDRVGLLYEVDHDVLRGSGRHLPHAAGAILRVRVNDRLHFTGPANTAVTVTFPGTSQQGPLLGSTRALAEAVGATRGDMMTVVLDAGEMSVSATVTDLKEHRPGWALIARLTGINEQSGIEGLSRALECSPGEVRATLRNRGDLVVLDSMPPRRLSSDLDYALAKLEAEVQRSATL